MSLLDAFTASFAAGASSAGAIAEEESCCTSGCSAVRQNVQFQPVAASAGDITSVRWPPKNTSPRAPLTIAW